MLCISDDESWTLDWTYGHYESLQEPRVVEKARYVAVSADVDVFSGTHEGMVIRSLEESI